MFSMFHPVEGCWNLLDSVPQLCWQNRMKSIICAESTCLRISSHVVICYLFPILPLDKLSNFYQIPYVFPSAVYWFFKVSTLVMREISLLSLSAAKHFWLGQEQEALGLSWARTHTFTHTWLAARPGVRDYSCYLRHISRQPLSKSVHLAWHSTPPRAF